MTSADLNAAAPQDQTAPTWTAFGQHVITPAGYVRAVATTAEGARDLVRALNLADQPVPALDYPVRAGTPDDQRIVAYAVDGPSAAWLNARIRRKAEHASRYGELADVNAELRTRLGEMRDRRDSLHTQLGEMTDARDAAHACATERAAQRDTAQRERDQLRTEILDVQSRLGHALAAADAARADADHAHQRLGELRQQHACETSTRELAADARDRQSLVERTRSLRELGRATARRALGLR